MERLVENLKKLFKRIDEVAELADEGRRVHDKLCETLSQEIKSVLDPLRLDWAREVFNDVVEIDGGEDLKLEIHLWNGKIKIKLYVQHDQWREEMERWARKGGVRDSEFYALLALRRLCCDGGIDELAEAVEKKLREVESVHKEVRDVLAAVKRALAPLVLASEL